jgi:hypothetical protein
MEKKTLKEEMLPRKKSYSLLESRKIVPRLALRKFEGFASSINSLLLCNGGSCDDGDQNISPIPTIHSPSIIQALSTNSLSSCSNMSLSMNKNLTGTDSQTSSLASLTVSTIPILTPRSLYDGNADDDVEEFSSKTVFSVKLPPPQSISNLEFPLTEKEDPSTVEKDNSEDNDELNQISIKSFLDKNRDPFIYKLLLNLDKDDCNSVKDKDDYNIINSAISLYSEKLPHRRCVSDSLLVSPQFYHKNKSSESSCCCCSLDSSERVSSPLSMMMSLSLDEPVTNTSTGNSCKPSSSFINSSTLSVTFSSLCELLCHLLHSETEKVIKFMIDSNLFPAVLSLLYHPVYSLTVSVLRCVLFY